MAYVSVESSRGAVVRVPDEHTDDAEQQRAHEWLLQLVWPYYNRALSAERDGRIPNALDAARTAVQYGAHAPRVLNSAFLIAVKHGDFAFAQQLLKRIRTLELDEASEFEALLHEQVRAWNGFLDDTDALHEKYRQSEVTRSYRELLLLAERGTELTTAERTHLSALGISVDGSSGGEATDEPLETVGTSWDIAGLAMACMLGILIGGAALYWGWGGEENTDVPVQQETASMPDTLVRDEQYGAALRVSTLLAEGQPVQAYRALGRLRNDSVHADAVDSLRGATHEALYRAGRRAWEREDYEQVVSALTPIRSKPVGAEQTKLYTLGVAAAQIGQLDLAVDVLQDLMPNIDSRHPHYEAQAAYLLVVHGPSAVARRYARLIVEKYDDTLYYNSVVRARLDEN